MTTVTELIKYLQNFPGNSIVTINKIISNSNIIDGYEPSEIRPYTINTKETTIINNGGIYQDGECLTEEEIIDKEIFDKSLSQKDLNYKAPLIKKIQKILILNSQ